MSLSAVPDQSDHAWLRQAVHRQDDHGWWFDCPVCNADVSFDPETARMEHFGDVFTNCPQTPDEADEAFQRIADAQRAEMRFREWQEPRTCTRQHEYRFDRLQCPDCLTGRRHAVEVDQARQQRESRSDDFTAWGRVDLLNQPEPEPPSVGEVSEGHCLLTRGKRHVLYGDGETGKTWLGVITACQEAAKGNVAVILSGEMDHLDLAHDVRLSGLSDEDIRDGLLVFPTSGLLDEGQRRDILTEVAATGRELTFVLVDSQTSVLSEAGLNPNNAEDVERLWRELGMWFIRLPSRPAFTVIDHVSKGADGASPTGSIRKRNIVDFALHVENVRPFSPKTVHGPASSGYSKGTITKGRRGGKGLIVAHIVGHDERVFLAAPDAPLPWVDQKPEPVAQTVAGIAKEAVAILREVAKQEGRPTDEVLRALGLGQNEGYRLLKSIAVDADSAGPGSLLIRRKQGRNKLVYLGQRGREVLDALPAVDDESEDSTSTTTST